MAEIDGAYFGATFPHVFLMTHAHLVPPPPTQVYVPRVYGYKVHSSSEYFTGKKKITARGGATAAASSAGGAGGVDKHRKAAGHPMKTAQQAR